MMNIDIDDSDKYLRTFMNWICSGPRFNTPGMQSLLMPFFVLGSSLRPKKNRTCSFCGLKCWWFSILQVLPPRDSLFHHTFDTILSHFTTINYSFFAWPTHGIPSWRLEPMILFAPGTGETHHQRGLQLVAGDRGASARACGRWRGGWCCGAGAVHHAIRGEGDGKKWTLMSLNQPQMEDISWDFMRIYH